MKQNGRNHMCTYASVSPEYQQPSGKDMFLKFSTLDASSSQEVVDEILMFHRSTPSMVKP